VRNWRTNASPGKISLTTFLNTLDSLEAENLNAARGGVYSYAKARLMVWTGLMLDAQKGRGGRAMVAGERTDLIQFQEGEETEIANIVRFKVKC